MDCFITRTNRLRRVERRFIADHLTRPGSDFQTALLTGDPQGTIALALDQGEIVGWARTEIWQGLPTLEAFVGAQYRRRGVARFCAAGLVAEGVYAAAAKVAIFSTTLIPLAKSIGITYERFALKPDGSWRLA